MLIPLETGTNQNQVVHSAANPYCIGQHKHYPMHWFLTSGKINELAGLDWFKNSDHEQKTNHSVRHANVFYWTPYFNSEWTLQFAYLCLVCFLNSVIDTIYLFAQWNRKQITTVEGIDFCTNCFVSVFVCCFISCLWINICNVGQHCIVYVCLFAWRTQMKHFSFVSRQLSLSKYELQRRVLWGEYGYLVWFLDWVPR